MDNNTKALAKLANLPEADVVSGSMEILYCDCFSHSVAPCEPVAHVYIETKTTDKLTSLKFSLNEVFEAMAQAQQ